MHLWHKIRRVRFAMLRNSVNAGLTVEQHFGKDWEGNIRDSFRRLEGIAVETLGNADALLTLKQAFKVK